MGREDHDSGLNDLVYLRALNDRHVSEAADVIEAQAKRIAELEKNYEEAREELTASYLCGYERAKSELSDRIEELEAALKPFLDNDWWEQIDWTDKTEREVWVTMADLRTARKVLGEKE